MIEDILGEKGVEYTVIRHGRAYSASKAAAQDDVSGYEFAKTVIATDGETFYMLVLPAVYEVELEKVGDRVGAELDLAPEDKMGELFPDCELGAEPPFGSLYDLPTWVDPSLGEQEYITFRAGTHKKSIRMRFEDYKDLEKPETVEFATLRKVEQYLSGKGVSYREMRHKRAYTAQEAAQAHHVTGYRFAKPVILTDGTDYYMVVVPAAYDVNLRHASDLIGADVRLADEKELSKLFPDSEVGAEPPFGSLYGLPTYMDTALEEHPKILFRAQTHDKSIEMTVDDYRNVENPVVGDLRVQHAEA